MCLRLTYAEALMWRNEASNLIAKAKAKSVSIPCDPLFGSIPRLSSLVSEIDGIKKRHGLLIEEALIFAINKLPDWQATKEKITTASGNAHLDCLAFNTSSRKLYVFECKRGHGSFDGDKIRAIDQRLDRISASIKAHVNAKGWYPSSCRTFLLSFYGATWNSDYSIFDRHGVAKLFEPCLGRFVNEFMDYVEISTSRAYGEEMLGDVIYSESENIFDCLLEERGEPKPDVLFNEWGCDFTSNSELN